MGANHFLQRSTDLRGNLSGQKLKFPPQAHDVSTESLWQAARKCDVVFVEEHSRLPVALKWRRSVLAASAKETQKRYWSLLLTTKLATLC